MGLMAQKGLCFTLVINEKVRLTILGTDDPVIPQPKSLMQ